MFPENLPPDVAAYFAAVDDKLAAFQSCSEVFDDLVKQQVIVILWYIGLFNNFEYFNLYWNKSLFTDMPMLKWKK